MNSTLLASRMMMIAKGLVGEAQRWPGTTRQRALARASRQLSWSHTMAFSKDWQTVAAAESLLEAATDQLVEAMVARAFNSSNIKEQR